MVTTNVDHELRGQLKEAGKLLSVPRPSIDNLLHILDQLEKLLSLVDQSPNNLMQEALHQPIKVLVDESLLEHSNMDVKVSVASCICEITRITAPEAPYSDDELKRIFQCIVSSFENLSDRSSRSYSKRVSILETVSKVRSCVIMLDLECDDLIVKLFEHFLNSVRDHHLDNIFSLMSNIMALVLEESEDISLDILKPLLASVKNNRVGVLPVARKLGEEVIKKSADKLRPYLKKAVTSMGDSLVDYSQVLTSICEGTTNFVEHNDESASVQPKVVETPQAILPSDVADKVNISNEKTLTGNEEDTDNKNSNKPEGAVDHPGSSLTSKLETNDLVAENLVNVELNHDTVTKPAEPLVSETVLGEGRVEKNPEIVVSVQKPLEAEVVDAPAQSGSQQEESQSEIQIKKGTQSKPSEKESVNAPSQSGSPQEESQSEIGIKSKPLESEVRNTPSQIGSQQEKSQSGIQIKKGIRSKKKGSGQTDRPSTVVVITNVSKGTSDPEIKSQKRVRKMTAKAEENKSSVTSGSDVETLKKSTKKLDKVNSGRKKTVEVEDNKPSVTSGSDVESLKKSSKNLVTVDSESKKKSLEDDDTALADVLVKAPESDSGMTSPKRVRKKTLKAEGYKLSATSGSDGEPLKKSTKKAATIDSVSAPVKRLGKKVAVADLVEDKPSVIIGSDMEPPDSEPKPTKRSGKKTGGGGSVAKKPKLSGKKAPESKKSKQDDKKEVEVQNSEVKPAKASLRKDNETDSDAKTPKQSGKKGQKSKIILNPSEDLANKDDEETDSDNKPLKPSEKKEEETDSDNEPLNSSENKEEETDSDHRQLNLPENKEDEETDSDNIPLSLAAKKGKKSGSSLVKSSLKNKDGKKHGRGKDFEEKHQTKSLSEDDNGMDVPIKSALKKSSKKKGNSEGALSTGSKRKGRATQKKVKETIKYDDSLVGQKVKVWWPHDKLYYEGVIYDFDPARKKHKVLYLDGDEEVLNLKNEKWEILKEYSARDEDAVEVQTTDVLPETGGNSKGESKVEPKEDEKEETKKDDKKEEPKKIVYSRGKKGSKRKTKSLDSVKDSEAGDAAAEPESQKDGSKSGNKRKKVEESGAADAVAEPESQKEKSTEGGLKSGSKRKNVEEPEAGDDDAEPESGPKRKKVN